METEPIFTESNPKPLQTEFKRDGMTHKLVKRVGMIAMFSVAGGREVVRIKLAKPQKFPGGEAPWRESYPSTEEFGTRGWYYPKEALASGRADAKFDELVKSQETK